MIRHPHQHKLRKSVPLPDGIQGVNFTVVFLQLGNYSFNIHRLHIFQLVVASSRSFQEQFYPPLLDMTRSILIGTSDTSNHGIPPAL
tara:strand:+ start:5241 stop:5501 length:261 start_codon:yes stop_codon:yes gene_type:complete